ncbi:MAG: glutathione synthetase [Cyclobacteriaceae bacterium]
MNIGFIVNDINTELPTYTTVNLAFRAVQMGHKAYLMGVGELVYLTDGRMGALASEADPKSKSSEELLHPMQARDFKKKPISSDELDVLFIRNDPSDDRETRPWAQSAGVIFGRIAMKQGVIVLNHPDSLFNALNKMYFQHFPEVVRPRTIISRNPRDIRDFYMENKQKIVLKPLQGSGGKDVFLLKEKATNLNQIVETIARNGYVIAQEYLPEAKNGDIRLMMMNGNPLQIDGKYAAFRRVNDNEDFRSNMSAGGHPEKAEITDEILELTRQIKGKLLQDGLFFVGLDIVGNKLMEINIFSPGGLLSSSKRYNVDFFEEMIKAIEKKVYYRDLYGGDISNKELAVID